MLLPLTLGAATQYIPPNIPCGWEGKGAATEPELAGTHLVAASVKQAQCLATFMLQVH